jgi:hypothetical protein
MRLPSVILITAALIGCSSSGDVAIGGGQTTGTATVDFAIAYIKREMPADPIVLAALRERDDVRQHRPFWTRADVYIRDQAAPSGTERNITAAITGTDLYDIKDLDASHDGSKLLFAMRGPLMANQESRDPPAWHIWQYDIKADLLTQLTGGATDTNPDAQDVSPHYLADDRVLFASTRQRDAKAVLTGEGKANFEAQTEDGDESAFALHVMEIDANTHTATGIRQISYNPSHDIDATLLASGRIMYSRWDHARGRSGGDGIHLYTANPDGSNVQLLYGGQSHATGSADASGTPSTIQFVKAREMQDGKVLALVRPFSGTDFGGNLHIIDVARYVENTQGLTADTALTGPAQIAATPNDVRTVPGASVATPLPSPEGRFNSAFPLWDGSGRILVSWSQCRLLDSTNTLVACTDRNLADPAMQPAPPLYSAWLFDPTGNTLKPVIEPVENTMLQDIVSLQPRTPPVFIADLPRTGSLAAAGLGILDLRSVYDFDGAATEAAVTAGTRARGNLGIGDLAQSAANLRPARFLRIEKRVSLGDPDLNDGFPRFDTGLADDRNMIEIIGYVPIEPDGSVRVKVPANIAFRIAVLDAGARRLGTFPEHTAWLNVRPGEVLACNGCHTQGSGNSHGRADLWDSRSSGAYASQWAGASAAGAAFPNTTSSAALPGCAGATMAQTLYGLGCKLDGSGASVTNLNGNATDIGSNSMDSAATPAADVGFSDAWFGGMGGNASISLPYGGSVGLATPLPIRLACTSTTSWDGSCRSIINYADSGAAAPVAKRGNIHPLWSLEREGGNTCTDCHRPGRDGGTTSCALTVNGITTTVLVPKVLGPDGGLDLTDDAAQDPAAQLRAFDQLTTTHTAPGDTGVDTITCTQTAALAVSSPPSIRRRSSAAASGRFFDRFAPGGTHAARLTPAELRLLTEWVDIGAQYYNNPFNVDPN